MLKTDDVAQFVAICGLMNYCASQEECKKCYMHEICNIIVGEKKLSCVIDKVKLERNNEFIESILCAEEEEEDD